MGGVVSLCTCGGDLSHADLLIGGASETQIFSCVPDCVPPDSSDSSKPLFCKGLQEPG